MNYDKMASRFLDMVANLDHWESGFQIVTTSQRLTNCLGKDTFRLDGANGFVFVCDASGAVVVVLDLRTVVGVTQPISKFFDKRA